ncbi:hypothetical protein SDC9_173422 [bioreactor metagenome]|uniref:Uncharacterized protein n=2 Tax=root TaxID=1 RepID=A0A645GIN7_9ZZZZ
MFIENQLFGVFLAEPVADILAALTTIMCFVVFYKKTLSVIENADNKSIKEDIINTH